MVFNSANRYKSIKYSWQKRHAPLRRPSMVEARMINSISGTLALPSVGGSPPFAVASAMIHVSNLLCELAFCLVKVLTAFEDRVSLSQFAQFTCFPM